MEGKVEGLLTLVETDVRNACATGVLPLVL